MANETPAVANTASNTYRYRDAEKRREYQRELMRKRRADPEKSQEQMAAEIALSVATTIGSG